MASPGQAAALNATADWCKWVATVQSGAIAVIGGIAAKGDHLNRTFRQCSGAALIFFALSVITAGFILSSIPNAHEHIGKGQHVELRETYLWRANLGSFAAYTACLGIFACLGIASFCGGVICQLFTR
ncbi:hypothetical protein SAMN05443244_2345 [Terriglobus roseus]|uniref:Uncharacterized protein n=1 Tax=Terriglobus roseus TaxID=392734 RepID=A0A1H4NUI4_9BACT|nr:hypothetical protein SAMN05443244_2345 [Terriglobus roseus]